jgi:hypothetical protein
MGEADPTDVFITQNTTTYTEMIMLNLDRFTNPSSVSVNGTSLRSSHGAPPAFKSL